jgi:predicted nucleotidyltransferase
MLFNAPFGGVVPGVQGAALAALLRTDTPLTGRQVYGLVRDDYSLWSVQAALKSLSQLGLIETRTIGRAGVHTVNEGHVAIAPLRALLDPIAALTDVVRESVGADVPVVILFGSVARGESTITSDVDLAVIASPGWDGRTDLEDAILSHLGNGCDVLVFTPRDFADPQGFAEPVIEEIRNDGIALIGSIPRTKSGCA